MSPDAVVTENLEARVIEIVSTHKKLPPGTVTLDSTFAELGIDSLDGMELVFEFEEAFNLTIPDTVAREMRGVRQVVDGLRQALTAPPPASPPAQQTEPQQSPGQTEPPEGGYTA